VVDAGAEYPVLDTVAPDLTTGSFIFFGVRNLELTVDYVVVIETTAL